MAISIKSVSGGSILRAAEEQHDRMCDEWQRKYDAVVVERRKRRSIDVAGKLMMAMMRNNAKAAIRERKAQRAAELPHFAD